MEKKNKTKSSSIFIPLPKMDLMYVVRPKFDFVLILICPHRHLFSPEPYPSVP